MESWGRAFFLLLANRLAGLRSFVSTFRTPRSRAPWFDCPTVVECPRCLPVLSPREDDAAGAARASNQPNARAGLLTARLLVAGLGYL